MRYKVLLLAATFAGAFTAIPASADPIMFQLTGSRNATFIVDPDLTPNFVSSSAFGDQISYDNIVGTYGGTPGEASIGFGNGLFAELNIGSSNLGFTQFAGPDFFKLVNSKPVFDYGTYSLTSIVSGASTLQISAVSAAPEPATWAMMVVGFGLIGGAIRYRRRKTTLSFA